MRSLLNRALVGACVDFEDRALVQLLRGADDHEMRDMERRFLTDEVLGEASSVSIQQTDG